MIGVIADDHRVLEWDLDCPGFPSKFAVHLDGHLGSHGHQTLGLAEHSGSHTLAGNRVLNAALGLHCSVMLT